MNNIPIWSGSSSFTTGSTPFGFYDTDTQFQTDADKVAKFCAQRLGYPISNVELQDINFYTAFEDSITTYGNELYAYKLRDNYLSIEGLSTGSNLNNSIITPNLSTIIKLSQQYASEAGVGGNVTYYSASIALTSSIQDYDLTEWALSQSISGGIEIKKIYYQSDPSINRYFNPYSGLGSAPSLPDSGLGMGVGTNFLLMPISYDLQVLQSIDFNDQIRRSQYSFILINNKLRIFPIPTETVQTLWFDYIKLNDRISGSVVSSPSQINNIGNVPFTNPTYTGINSIGRSWIFEYTLAICKEMLGYIRGKYQTIPVPGDGISLNQADLLGDAKSEKEILITKLKDYFDSTSRQSLLERRNNESIARNAELSYVPNPIFIG